MATLNQIVTGLKSFVDCEFLPKINGLNKWIVGAGVSLALDDATNIFNNLKSNDFVEMLNIINKDDEIDIDRLHESFIEQSRKSAVTFSIPFVGAVTLTEKDIEKIYQKILES